MNNNSYILSDDKGYSIYIHVPFCRSRCLYCSFYSSTKKVGKQLYLSALKNEIIRNIEWLENSGKVKTVYFGGGTPSSIDPELLSELIFFMKDIIGENFQPSEITLEINPEDVSVSNMEIWTKCGINRYSMGVQSLVDEELRLIGRRHDKEQILTAARILHKSGNLSLDLICGLPKQNIKSFNYSLDGILQLHPEHISVYMLELEKNSPLQRLVETGRISLPDENEVRKMYLLMCERLSTCGYEHYEISNFALHGYRSMHNSSYWNGTPYIGFGPGAASYLRYNQRCVNKPDLDAYISEDDIRIIENLSTDELMVEYILTRLRTAHGLNLDEYCNLFGLKEYKRLLKRAYPLIQKRCLTLNDGILFLTNAEACLISDAIMVELIR